MTIGKIRSMLTQNERKAAPYCYHDKVLNEVSCNGEQRASHVLLMPWYFFN
jgi:hypothetical protein